MEAIILAGGFGRRIQAVVRDMPKPMAPVAGKPFLQYILESLTRQKINRIILAVGYKHEIIEDYFGSSFQSAELVYSVETEPLGTGGAIRMAVEMCRDKEMLIVNGDTFFDVPLADLLDFHLRGLYDLTLSLKPMENFDRYGTVITSQNRVTGMKEKQPCDKGLINGGVYLLNRNILDEFPVGEPFSFEKEILEKKVEQLKIGAFISDGYFIDIGIPEDYYKAQKDFSC